MVDRVVVEDRVGRLLVVIRPLLSPSQKYNQRETSFSCTTLILLDQWLVGRLQVGNMLVGYLLLQ
jgi:hypothetical protein